MKDLAGDSGDAVKKGSTVRVECIPVVYTSCYPGHAGSDQEDGDVSGHHGTVYRELEHERVTGQVQDSDGL